MNGPNISPITNTKQNTDVRLMFLLDVRGRHLPKVPDNAVIGEVRPSQCGSSDEERWLHHFFVWLSSSLIRRSPTLLNPVRSPPHRCLSLQRLSPVLRSIQRNVWETAFCNSVRRLQ